LDRPTHWIVGNPLSIRHLSPPSKERIIDLQRAKDKGSAVP
jgi:hypothetical protein